MNFGLSLVLLGALLLTVGIWYHVQFMSGLRAARRQMTADGLIHGESFFPISLTLIVAGLLLLVGVLAEFSMIFNAGPFD